MKALILAGGRGKRLNELSAERNKCMIEIGGRPVIEYSLDCAVASEADEIVLVVGYRAEEIINYLGNSYKGKKLTYVIQWEQHGLVHAIECAKNALKGHDFLLLLGDEMMKKPRHKEMIKEFNATGSFAMCGVLKVDDRNLIKKTYTLITSGNDVIYRLIEKPKNPLNDYMGTGDCVFKNDIFRYIEFTPIHHERNEKELPDMIQCAIDNGEKVKSFFICEKYTNINTKEDIEYAERFIL